jgi:AraC-like DNA-binding protein
MGYVAVETLRARNVSLIEIDLHVGYKNPSHFAQAFGAWLGLRLRNFGGRCNRAFFDQGWPPNVT